MRADDVYILLKGKITKLTEEIKKTQDWKPIHFVASVKTAEDLPKSPEEGDMYNIETDSEYGSAGMNVVWTVNGWDNMGPIIDLTPYLTKEKADELYQPKGNYPTKAEVKEGYQPKDDYVTTTEADDKYQTKTEAAEEKAAVIDLIYRNKVATATTKAEVDTLFVEWWNSQYNPDTYTKADMLERWFGNVLVDNRIHGVKTPRYAKSTSLIGELTDDSTGLVCTPSTEAVAGDDPFAHLPQFWCLEVSAEKNADGSHVIYDVEHIDSIDDVRSGEHLCWVLQKNTWKREWQDSEYKYLKMQCKEAEGYKRWPEGKDRTGKIHEYMAHPKYPVF
mgnify:CR=1 FL=1